MRQFLKDACRRIVSTIGVVFVLLAIYVLSTGPAVKLRVHLAQQGGPNVSIEGFYQPVEWCTDRSPMFREFIRWYIHTVWDAFAALRVAETQ